MFRFTPAAPLLSERTGGDPSRSDETFPDPMLFRVPRSAFSPSSAVLLSAGSAPDPRPPPVSSFLAGRCVRGDDPGGEDLSPPGRWCCRPGHIEEVIKQVKKYVYFKQCCPDTHAHGRAHHLRHRHGVSPRRRSPRSCLSGDNTGNNDNQRENRRASRAEREERERSASGVSSRSCLSRDVGVPR